MFLLFPHSSSEMSNGKREPLFFRFAVLLFFAIAAMLAFRCEAADYTRTVRLGTNKVVIPQSVAETRRLFGDSYQYLNRSHLILISDLDQRTLTQLELQDFQAYLTILTRQLFTRALNSSRKDNTAIPVIFLFKDHESYRKGLRDMGLGDMLDSEMGRGNLRRGYQFNSPEVNGVLIDYRDNYAHGLSIYAHELTHALVRMEYPQAPIWINEGLATMFGHCKVEGGQLQYMFGEGLARLKQGLRGGGVLPLARLFESTSKDFMGGGHLQYYDAAELLCRYLHSRDLLVQVYIEMRDGRGKGVNGSETVARVAGRTPEELEKDWHQWLKEQGRR